MKKHKKRKCGWTGQEARCDYAVWWDCSFLCVNKKINPKGATISCKLNIPNFKQCKELKKIIK